MLLEMLRHAAGVRPLGEWASFDAGALLDAPQCAAIRRSLRARSMRQRHAARHMSFEMAT